MGMRLFRNERAVGALSFLAALLASCTSAWATQEHGDPEGLYVHQLAHLFFMFSMVVLFAMIRRMSPLSKGWRRIGLAALLFILWNIDTFTVHWIREDYLSQHFFSGSAQDWDQVLDVSTFEAKLYYAGRVLDHVFLVGAIAAFLTGIKAFKEKLDKESAT